MFDARRPVISAIAKGGAVNKPPVFSDDLFKLWIMNPKYINNMV